MSTKLTNAPATAAQIAAMAKAVPSTQVDETKAELTFVEPKVVKHTYTWKSHQGGEKQTKTSIFDFKACTEQQLITLAMSTVVIHIQATLRNAANSNPQKGVDPNLLSHVNVLKDVIQTMGTKADPIAQAIAKLRAAGASEETVKKVAAELHGTK